MGYTFLRLCGALSHAGLTTQLTSVWLNNASLHLYYKFASGLISGSTCIIHWLAHRPYCALSRVIRPIFCTHTSQLQRRWLRYAWVRTAHDSGQLYLYALASGASVLLLLLLLNSCVLFLLIYCHVIARSFIRRQVIILLVFVLTSAAQTSVFKGIYSFLLTIYAHYCSNSCSDNYIYINRPWTTCYFCLSCCSSN